MRLRIASLFVLGVGLVGCEPGGAGSDAIKDMDRAALASEAEVRTFAEFNPIYVYYLTQAMSHGSLGELAPGSEEGRADCPRIVEEGSVRRIVGNCTDDEGTRYVGEVEFAADEAGAPYGTLTFKGFGTEYSFSCGEGETATEVTTSSRFDGRAVVRGDASASELDFNFAVTGNEVDDDTCESTQEALAFVFKGRIDGAAPTFPAEGEAALTLEPTTWSGKGQIGASPYGYVDYELIDEVVDFEVCNEGAASGTSRLTGEKEVEITFRGAETCGASATWTLDGVAQGELEGVHCSAVGG